MTRSAVPGLPVPAPASDPDATGSVMASGGPGGSAGHLFKFRGVPSLAGAQAREREKEKEGEREGRRSAPLPSTVRRRIE
eukprot:2656716-Rhodomonas_salina.2